MRRSPAHDGATALLWYRSRTRRYDDEVVVAATRATARRLDSIRTLTCNNTVLRRLQRPHTLRRDGGRGVGVSF